MDELYPAIRASTDATLDDVRTKPETTSPPRATGVLSSKDRIRGGASDACCTMPGIVAPGCSVTSGTGAALGLAEPASSGSGVAGPAVAGKGLGGAVAGTKTTGAWVGDGDGRATAVPMVAEGTGVAAADGTGAAVIACTGAGALLRGAPNRS